MIQIAEEDIRYMPCQLRSGSSPAIDFEGPVDQPVSISVRATGDNPAAVELDFVRYNGKTTHVDPARMTIAPGVKPLIVGLRGTVDGQMGNLVEICGDGTEKKLRKFKYIALDPVKSYVLEGV